MADDGDDRLHRHVGLGQVDDHFQRAGRAVQFEAGGFAGGDGERGLVHGNMIPSLAPALCPPHALPVPGRDLQCAGFGVVEGGRTPPAGCRADGHLELPGGGNAHRRGAAAAAGCTARAACAVALAAGAGGGAAVDLPGAGPRGGGGRHRPQRCGAALVAAAVIGRRVPVLRPDRHAVEAGRSRPGPAGDGGDQPASTRPGGGVFAR
ncbi:hypothetical protein G6F68_010850 [Rhizopus microsporus]|nr:hypothetical protein G6F68_010850 [Rhizopus microsporus]